MIAELEGCSSADGQQLRLVVLRFRERGFQVNKLAALANGSRWLRQTTREKSMVDPPLETVFAYREVDAYSKVK